MFTYLKCFPDVDLPFRRYMVSALNQGNHHLETVSMTSPIRHRFAPTLSFRMVNCARRIRRPFTIKSSVFQAKSSHIKSFLCCNATSVLNRNEKISNTKTLKVHDTFWQVFFAAIALLTLSNLIEILVAMRSSF